MVTGPLVLKFRFYQCPILYYCTPYSFGGNLVAGTVAAAAERGIGGNFVPRVLSRVKRARRGYLVASLPRSLTAYGIIHKGRLHRGGRGGLRNLQILWTNSTDRLREMQTRGREGVQNPKKFADVLYE